MQDKKIDVEKWEVEDIYADPLICYWLSHVATYD